MQVKCSYSSNDSVFTIGSIYDVHIVYGNEAHTMSNCLALIDNHDEYGYSGRAMKAVKYPV